MEKQLIGRGALAGALAGLVAFVFARIFAEPVIQRAIDYESGRDAAQALLDKAAGHPAAAEGSEIFSRTVQGTLGIGAALVLFGAAMGALVAVAFAVCLGRVGRVRARPLALLVCAGGFLSFFWLPFLKYPANPPAIGHEDTIRTRGTLYLVMVFASVFLLVVAVRVGQLLRARFGTWNATVLAGAAYLVVMGLVMWALPGVHETPGALRNPGGTIVFPGFPADVLARFRVYSVVSQLLLWGVIALVFAPLADRVLRPVARTSAAPVPSTA